MRKIFATAMWGVALTSLCGSAWAWAPISGIGASAAIFEPANDASDASDNPPLLLVACKGNAVSVEVLYNQAVGESVVRATLDFADTGAQTANYEAAADGMGFYLENGNVPGTKRAVSSLIQLFSVTSDEPPVGKRTLEIIVYPPHKAPTTAVFDVAGFDDAYAPVGTACGTPIPTD